jgi:hypothetical protein
MSGGSAIEAIHATCVAIGGRGVLIAGPSGSGKSDLALRLMDRGAILVSDDYTSVTRVGGVLEARAPTNIAGRIEVRGIGIVEREVLECAPVALYVAASPTPERMPEAALQMIAGIGIRRIELALLEASAPIKVELALELEA